MKELEKRQNRQDEARLLQAPVALRVPLPCEKEVGAWWWGPPSGE